MIKKLRCYSEYLLVKMVLLLLGSLPRKLSYAIAAVIARICYLTAHRLRLIALRNLEIAMPQLDENERQRMVKKVFDNFARLLAEFSYFPRYTRQEISKVVEYEGLDNYLKALSSGRGVLMLTAHLGAWELSSFAHSLNGYPHNILIRKIDNPYIDQLVEKYRTLHGNRTIDKNNASRAVLSALRKGEAVGILIDLNTVRNMGIFCDFFGLKACSTPGLATLALRTNAVVLPSFTFWDEQRQVHIIHFGREVEIIRTGDLKEDIRLNTERFQKIVEEYVRRHPDQWLWVHRRWKTRPEGEAELY
ncbi:MAG: lysophospholipid acyltransferase family protein [Acidobacteriota bacterium]|nr:lysophospholipid acyltransferase family protein [Blastocatellia bacterium]MDW8412341.1 lysophospholipid acyltransferase family protein [Acidobacteriota bacterium]